MTTDPGSRARALVRRARGRAFRHRAFRVAARGIAAGALIALALAALARIAGFDAGAWVLVAFAPALALALPALRRARPDSVEAALLLDRAAGTKERFATAVAGSDPEVRELAARQALENPAFRDGAFPLSFPPTTEGLVAVLSLVLLAAAFWLVPPPANREERTASAGGAPVAAAGGAPATGSKGEPAEAAPTPASYESASAKAVAKLASGEGLDEDDWDSLSPEGVSPEERDRIEAALGRGDPAAAAEALRRALAEGGRGSDAGSPPGTEPAPGERWAAYRRALRSPVWSAEHDDVVRRYFDAMAGGR